VKEVKKKISLDQFYTEKFSKSDLQFDSSAGWAQLENQRKLMKISYLKLLFAILVLVAITASVYFLREANLPNDSLVQKETTNIMDNEAVKSNYNNKIDNIQAGNEAQEISQIQESTTKSTIHNQEINRKASTQARIIESTTSRKNKNLLDSNGQTELVVEKDNSYLDKYLNNKSSVNVKESGVIQSELNSSTISAETKTTSNFIINDDELNFGVTEIESTERSLLAIGLLNTSLTSLTMPDHDQFTIEMIKPIASKTSHRWSLDLGLNFRKEYNVTSDFELLKSNNKIRFSHVSIALKHLNNRYFNTYAFISYDKLYGEQEFEGERIVRTYKDDNFSLGYGISVALNKAFEIESGISFGLSLIDKVEYEQKPTWIDGAIQYHDYTETVYSMNPVPTYQIHTKLTYHLRNKLHVFSGIVYRTQLVDRFQSKLIARENSLETFADLQFLTGIRYNIN